MLLVQFLMTYVLMVIIEIFEVITYYQGLKDAACCLFKAVIFNRSVIKKFVVSIPAILPNAAAKKDQVLNQYIAIL